MTDDQLNTEARPAPRTLDDWTATIAAAALVAGGFLVSIAGPMLRKLYDARRAELDEARELVGEQAARLADLAPPEAAVIVGQGDELGPDPGADVWAAAAERWSSDHPGVGAELDGADPAATVPDGS